MLLGNPHYNVLLHSALPGILPDIDLLCNIVTTLYTTLFTIHCLYITIHCYYTMTHHHQHHEYMYIPVYKGICIN